MRQVRKFQERIPGELKRSALVIIVGLLIASSSGLVSWAGGRQYVLAASTKQLVGASDASLTKQLKFDPTTQTYEFNGGASVPSTDCADGQKLDPGSLAAVSCAKAMASTIGNFASGASAKSSASKEPYSLSVPLDPTQGITYHDTNTGLSFGLIPKFQASAGQKVDGHIVFPLAGASQAIYTLKDNGLKEDIVVQQASADKMTFSYKLNLPKTLAARMMDDGSVGIYSADPNLFGNISFGDDSADQAKIMKARESSPKDHLVFGLPAPVVKDANDNAVASAKFELKGKMLTVVASGLTSVKAPFTIDPSVVVSSASQFATGNSEGNITFNSGGGITRGGLTGGSLNSATGSWSTNSNALPQGLYTATSVVYNGYIYELGGYNGSANQFTTYYAPLNANGSIGAWNPTTSLPQALTSATSVVYNGYIYELGGINGSSQVQLTTYYAPLHTDGTIGAWNPTTSLPQVIYSATSVAYNGYIYELGGSINPSPYRSAVVYYAPLNADGTMGNWGTTATLPQILSDATSVVYNGYIYELGGATGTTGTVQSTVYYAPLNANGTIGAWVSTTSLPQTLEDATSVVYNGYIYELGGRNSVYQSTVYYAPLNANGAVGAWVSTTSLPQALLSATTVAYGGYIYELGGANSSFTMQSTVYYAKIDPAGSTAPYVTASNSLPAARDTGTSVVYNGYIYYLGGYTGSATVTNTYYAPINADGSIGAWASTTVLKKAIYYSATVAYNGYIYMLGGEPTNTTNTNATYYAPLNTNGSIGAWTATTVLPQAIGGGTSAVYNGYVYLMNGNLASGQNLANVYYAPLNTNGTIGTWITTAPSTPTAFNSAASALYGGYIYIVGGYTNTCVTTTYYTQIGSNGAPGSWQTGPPLPVGLSQPTAVAYNGYLYVLGGTNPSYVNVSTVYVAQLGTNGAIGTWSTTASLPQIMTASASVAYNGFIYEVGGTSNGTTGGGTPLATVYYAQINNGGPGTAGGWTTSANTFTTGRDAQATVTYNGYIYLLGGKNSSGSPLNDTQYAKLNADGSMGAWATASNTFTTARYAFKAVAYNGYLYIMGGFNGSTADYNDVQYSQIAANGSLGTWVTSPNSFTNIRDSFAVSVYNGYLYLMGGCNSSGSCTDYNDVQYTSFNADGSIASWQTNATSFTTARDWLDGFAYNGYLYILGGENGSTDLSDVQFAPINANGTVGTWAATTSLPSARQGMTVAAYNGYVYAVAGDTASTGSDLTDVLLAPINANGTIGAWQKTVSITNAREWATNVIYNGFLYIMGGRNNSTYYADTQYAPLNSIARLGHYSKLIDLGSTMTISGISYTGTLPGGTSAISYEAAGTNGVFGSASTAAALASSVSGSGQCATSPVTARYIYLFVTLDDSGGTYPGAGVFPDSLGTNNASVQSLTVNYSTGVHPPPNIRLRMGQTLQTGVLSPFDTCGP